MKAKITGVSITFLIDPELGDNKPFEASGNITNLLELSQDEQQLLSKLSDSAFPLEQVQTSLSAMAQVDYQNEIRVETPGIDYVPGK